MLVFFVHTSLSPALPIIAQDFAASTSVSSWVMTAYKVSEAVILFFFLEKHMLVTRSEGDPILKICPFSTFEDLQESIYLMKYSNGVIPYVLEWNNEVFLIEFNEKRNSGNNDETRRDNGKEYNEKNAATPKQANNNKTKYKKIQVSQAAN